MNVETSYKDFESKIWGCHFHMDVAENDFPKALLVQEAFLKFFDSKNIPYTSANSFRPGYGPHTKHMWEVRLEPNTKDSLLFDKIGVAFTWLMLNRNGLDAYVHPLSQSKEKLDLITEWEDHLKRTLKLGEDPNFNLDFFTHPPVDPKNPDVIQDTRQPNMYTPEEEKNFRAKAIAEGTTLTLQSLESAPFVGFHIHLDYENTIEKYSGAKKLHDVFIKFLKDKESLYGSNVPYAYGPGENGPHVYAGWVTALTSRNGISNQTLIKKIGLAIGWLMMNRNDQPVYIHPIPSIRSGQAEIDAHTKYIMSFDKLPPLNLDFFKNWN